MSVDDANLPAVNLELVLLRQSRYMAIVIAGHTTEIGDFLKVVDQVLGMEIPEMDDHIHPGKDSDQGRWQLADFMDVCICYYTYFHDIKGWLAWFSFVSAEIHGNVSTIGKTLSTRAAGSNSIPQHRQ